MDKMEIQKYTSLKAKANKSEWQRITNKNQQFGKKKHYKPKSDLLDDLEGDLINRDPHKTSSLCQHPKEAATQMIDFFYNCSNI